jgi:hypothetical protein
MLHKEFSIVQKRLEFSLESPSGCVCVYIIDWCQPLSQWTQHIVHELFIFYKNTNHQQMHKESLSLIVTHSYMFRPCCVIFRENFSYRYAKVALYSWVRLCCWLLAVYCVVLGGVAEAFFEGLLTDRHSVFQWKLYSSVVCLLTL